MKIGRTAEDREAVQSKLDKINRVPHRWFAWRPVFTDSRRFVWLETVNRYQSWALNDDGSYRYWRYKEIGSNTKLHC